MRKTAQGAERGRCFRPSVLWGAILAVLAARWWALERTMRRLERTLAELDVELPPRALPRVRAWVLAAGGAAVGLLLAGWCTRRGRALLAPRREPWELAGRGTLHLTAFTVYVVVAAVPSILASLVVEADALRSWLPWVEQGAFAVAVAYACWCLGGVRGPLSAWGWRRGRGILREAAIGTLAAFALRPLHYVDLTFGLGSAAGTPYLLYAIAWAPVMEETAFRGMLYRDLRDRTSWVAAVLAGAAVFALLHHPAWRWPGLFVAGIAYGLLRTWRGSLIAPVTAHAVGNAVALL